MDFIVRPVRSLADIEFNLEMLRAELARVQPQLPQAGAVADLELTAAVSYDAGQLQAMAAKVDELLGALRAAGLLAPSS